MAAIIATAPVPAASRLDIATTDTLPRLPETQPCPAWCAHHYTDPDDGARLHRSDATIVRTAVGRESHEVSVEVGQLELPVALAAQAHPGETGRLLVHLEGADQVDMAPAQALELAQALIEHAHRALGTVTGADDTALAYAFEIGRRYERIVLDETAA